MSKSNHPFLSHFGERSNNRWMRYNLRLSTVSMKKLYFRLQKRKNMFLNLYAWQQNSRFFQIFIQELAFISSLPKTILYARSWRFCSLWRIFRSLRSNTALQYINLSQGLREGGATCPGPPPLLKVALGLRRPKIKKGWRKKSRSM